MTHYFQQHQLVFVNEFTVKQKSVGKMDLNVTLVGCVSILDVLEK